MFEPSTAVLQPAAGQVTGVVSVSAYELVRTAGVEWRRDAAGSPHQAEEHQQQPLELCEMRFRQLPDAFAEL